MRSLGPVRRVISIISTIVKVLGNDVVYSTSTIPVWTGDEKTRKSTSEGSLMLETGCEEEEQSIAAIHTWSRAQGPIAFEFNGG